MKPFRAAMASGCVLAALTASGGDTTKTVGRVRVTELRTESAAAEETVTAALGARAGTRVVSVRPRPGEPNRFDATIYDHTLEQTFELVVDSAGAELSRRAVPGQPARTIEERDAASRVVRESALFGESIAAGTLEIYEAMPPVTVDGRGRRLVNVGVMAPPVGGKTTLRNEIVSVHLPTGEIVRHPSGAPEGAKAAPLACGPGTSGCSYATGPCTPYQIVWPASDPVWTMKVRHPSCTSSVQGDGTGLEITDVYYRGRLILKRGEVPVLNVVYDGNSCGPFRDWLFSEDCFQAVGTDVPSAGSGVRVTTSAPGTLCESESDAGNFKGIAIYDEGDALWLMTETNAGWYRYVHEWRFHLDGTIEPIFGFGATSNSCTCNTHDHHAYFRLEWGLDAAVSGGVDDPATGIATLERLRAGTVDTYDPVPAEATFIRPPADPDKDYFRVRNPQSGNGYVIQPGTFDGSASGDAYGKWDLTAVALNSGQINDPNTDTSVNVAPWVNGESLGTTKRLVTWYRAGYRHDVGGGDHEACELAGPKLVPLIPCAGSIALDRPSYTCSSSVTAVLNDSDLAGTGTAVVQVTSPIETVPEPVTLTETPAGSGRFVGTVGTTAAAPATGDGLVSVANGSALNMHYIDASACGQPNVGVDKAATIDCVSPSILNLRVTPSDTTATIQWETAEPSTTGAYWGSAIPTSGSGTTSGLAAAHSVAVAGLAPCTTYYYWAASEDAAGNVAASNAGGGYQAFTTLQSFHTDATSTDGPVAIPDNNPTGATSTIPVASTPAVQDVDVTVNITHTWDGDLTLSLIAPTNTSVTLAARRGNSGHNFTGTVFDDEAATAIASGAPPFTGSFRPEGSLSVLDGIPANGNWRLKVVDAAGQDVGTIDSWSLSLAQAAGTCAPVAPPPPAAGMTAARIPAPSGTSIHLAWDTAACPAPSYHLVYGFLSNLSTYAVGGALCDVGPLGSYDWQGVRSGDLWFVVVGNDARGTEGSWGALTPPGERNGTTASGSCGVSARTNAATCP